MSRNKCLGLILLFIFSFHFVACENKKSIALVEWDKKEMFQLPQQVIDFFYSAEENPKKLFVIMDSAYQANEAFVKSGTLTETHYIITINHQQINIRERDFRAPYFIFKGTLYYSKSRILKGKLMTPQDLFIYAVDLKTIIK